MEKFVPFEKLSKKKQKELNKAKRNTWGLTDPVTKCSENKKIYNRKKAKRDTVFDTQDTASRFLFNVSSMKTKNYYTVILRSQSDEESFKYSSLRSE